MGAEMTDAFKFILFPFVVIAVLIGALAGFLCLMFVSFIGALQSIVKVLQGIYNGRWGF
jgi:cell division protein FtsX